MYPPDYYETYGDGQVFFGGMEKPLNLTIVPAEAYAEAYRAGKKQKFADHVGQVANYVWWNMSYGDNNGVTFLYWLYWPVRPAGYYAYMEDTSHGALTAKFATTLRRSGIANPFNDTRLQYLANTFKYSIMNSSATMLWRMNDPTSTQVEAKDAYLCAEWLSLTPYDTGTGTNIYAWCENILSAAGYDPRSEVAVFAGIYRYSK